MILGHGLDLTFHAIWPGLALGTSAPYCGWLKLWETRTFVGIYRGSSCQGFLGGAAVRPSTVGWSRAPQLSNATSSKNTSFEKCPFVGCCKVQAGGCERFGVVIAPVIEGELS